MLNFHFVCDWSSSCIIKFIIIFGGGNTFSDNGY